MTPGSALILPADLIQREPSRLSKVCDMHLCRALLSGEKGSGSDQ